VNGFNFIVADTKKYREEARLKAVKAAEKKRSQWPLDFQNLFLPDKDNTAIVVLCNQV
jgi:hypothetical protein